MKTEITRWNEKIKGLDCEIVNWSNAYMEKDDYPDCLSKTKWNSYILIRRKNIPRQFHKFVLEPIKYKIVKNSPIRYRFDYYQLEDYFDFHGGITYWEYLRDELGEIWGLKVGCDYDHLYDEKTNWTYEILKSDLENSLDKFLSHFKDYYVSNNYDHKYLSAKDNPKLIK